MNSIPLPRGLVLSTNDVQTWKGWCLLNDREIVRISAELGTQINLAQIFIAARRSWDLDEVEKWYKAEVTAWVIQLLSAGEITITVQILENTKIDVITQLLVIAIEVKDRKTIKTVSDYLSVCVKSEIDEIQDNINNFLHHFYLLNSLESYLLNNQQLEIIILENDLLKTELITLEETKNYTVQDIQKQSKIWKSKIAARLYYNCLDFRLTVFLDAETSWEDLLQSNNIKYLKSWLFTFFTKCKYPYTEATDVVDFHELFQSWEITDNMISRIACFPCMDFTKEELYDYMTTFGYFIEVERKNIVLLLRRLSRNRGSSTISDIFKQKSSNISLDHFFKLLVDYCESKELKTVITKCMSSRLFYNDFIHNISTIDKEHWINVSITFLDLIQSPNDESIILKCINYASNYLAGNNINQYLIENPYVYIATILFDKTKNLSTTFSQKILDTSSENVEKQVFGHKAKLTYDYYIKSCAPCFAISLYANGLLDEKNMCFSSDGASNVTYKLIMKNWNDIEVFCSGISFMIILGMDCCNLRNYINAAHFIRNESLKLTYHEGKVFDINHITKLLENITSDANLVEFLSLIERTNMNCANQSFINIISQWKTTYNICVLHNIRMTNSFLIFSAKIDKWIWFLLFAQIYLFVQEQVSEATKYFNNYALQTHLAAALENKLEPEHLILCWYTWLCSATGYINLDNGETLLNISPEDISSLINFCVIEGFVTQLNESLLIFVPSSCFAFFTNILVRVIVNNEIGCDITNLLVAFKNITMHLHIIPHLTINNIFEDRRWLINKAIDLCCIALSYNFMSFYHCKAFLKCLSESKLTKNIDTDVNFDDLLNILQCLYHTNVNLNISSILLSNNEEIIQNEYSRCLKQLINGHYFENAFKFAEITNINTDDIIIAHMKYRCNNLLTDVSNYMNYWLDCNKIFNDSKLVNKNATSLFLEFAENSNNPKLRYILYHLALISENSVESNSKNMDEIEKKMWINYIDIENPDDVMLYSSKLSDFNNTPVILHNSIDELKIKACINNLTISDYPLSTEQSNNLFKLISMLLDLGDFITALRIQMMFMFSHSELQLLITIMALAESSLSPYQMTPAQRMTLLQSKCVRTASGQFGKRTLKSKISSSNSVCGSPNSSFASSMFSDYIEIPSREKQDTLCTIEALAARLKAGRFSGQRIVMCYRAAMHMDVNYLDILRENDVLNLLKQAINGNCLNKLVVISDIISASGFTSLQIAEFLAYEIFKAILQSINVKTKRDVSNFNVATLWGYNLSVDFHLFLELCPNPSDIGNELLKYQSSIQQIINKNTKKLTIIDINTVCVDILIYAHDSFTKDCNIEGISLILGRAHMLCSQLLQTKSWGLMVKLLTGISRYTEMTYIFDIIKSNHQFEFLLSQFNCILKQHDSKKNDLKMALLEFLKTYWPQDSELKRLVALHFQMHSEVAELLNIEATEIIRRMINISMLDMTSNDLNFKDFPVKCPPFVLLENTAEIRDCLIRAMNTYSHSSEYYVQQNKLSLAMKSAAKAELVACQIDLLNKTPAASKGPSVICILQLKPEQIPYVVNNVLSFHQAIILQRAYDYTVNWVSALYEHCIINGDMQYLNSYNKYFKITENIASELAMRFQKETRITKQMIQSLRCVVGCLNSIADRYRLASLLGQRDIVENILSSESVCYLKDTVFIGKKCQ
ncbi:spatacsin-like [Ctenocephalides felis]|uniref:spatacsin-like n=1 Tax=Ctenocephalides felis TaxID=7515 RepID=UPI000E6E4317|nr:spatacsin-like [Ctenocephalides felis]